MSLFAGEDISICVCLAILTYLFDEQGNKTPKNSSGCFVFLAYHNVWLPYILWLFRNADFGYFWLPSLPTKCYLWFLIEYICPSKYLCWSKLFLILFWKWYQFLDLHCLYAISHMAVFVILMNKFCFLGKINHTSCV